MVLPLYLAMNASEMTISPLPDHCAWMACHFSPCSQGVSNIPASLPSGSMLILNDRNPCQGHSADLVAAQINEAATRLGCESVLLDFQRPGNIESATVAAAIIDFLSIPVAVSESYAAALPCPVFLGPSPLHVPLDEHIAPWQGREIWLEAALEQETVTVTEKGAEYARHFPPEGLIDGFYSQELCCHYQIEKGADRVAFTLFDTPDSLEKKLSLAASLGVSRAVGLWQELGTFLTGKSPA